MNDKDRERLKTIIRNRISQLQQVLDGGSDLATKKLQQDDDEAANLDLTINAMVDSNLVNGFRREVSLLTQNLNWLDRDDGGYCSLCGEPIALARLMAVPQTRRCIGCANSTGT